MEVQEASAYFFAPTALAYLLACAGWFAVAKSARGWWPDEEWPTTERRWLDLSLGPAAVAGILLLGQVWRAGWLLPVSGEGLVNAMAWTVNNVVIYSPLFLVLAVRKQHPRTVFLSAAHLGRKVGLGAALGMASVILFVALRGEWARLPEILAATLELNSLENFFPVFMEGVAVAFLFVRLKWAVGMWPAILLPSLVFAFAHVPGSLEGGRSAAYILAFFLFNGGLTCAILYTVQRSRDIVWIGIVHYLMNVATGAF